MSNLFEKKYKTILLDTFKRLILFLEGNDIRWWAAYGTMLGAVRHGGLIPWDDDIDIWVPRKDYERLLTMSQSMSQEGLTLHTPIMDESYVFGWAKVCDSNSTIWEHRVLPVTFGVFIDIFPLDNVNCSKEELSVLQKRYNDAMHLYMDVVAEYGLREYLSVVRHASYKVLINRIRFRNRIGSLKIDLINASCALANKGIGDYLATVFGTPGFPDFFDASWFTKTIEMPFEDFSVKIPSGYHECLAALYGDYMTPPPESGRVSTHERYYCNLQEGLTVQEAKNRVKRGEHIVF